MKVMMKQLYNYLFLSIFVKQVPSYEESYYIVEMFSNIDHHILLLFSGAI